MPKHLCGGTKENHRYHITYMVDVQLKHNYLYYELMVVH